MSDVSWSVTQIADWLKDQEEVCKGAVTRHANCSKRGFLKCNVGVNIHRHAELSDVNAGWIPSKVEGVLKSR